MAERGSVNVGDWVRFYFGGRLVIGLVAYVQERPFGSDRDLVTDAGFTSEESVLETRAGGASK